MKFENQELFCITYKSNQADFNIYSRKLHHNFKVNVYQDDFENAIGLNLDNSDEILVCKKDGKIFMFDSISYKVTESLDLKLERSHTREPLQILSINKSKDDSTIALIVGKQMIKDLE